MSGLAAVTERIRLIASVAVLTMPRPIVRMPVSGPALVNAGE